MIVAGLPHLIGRSARQGKPNLCRARREHLRRHHADDRVGLVAEIYRASEHIRVARKKAGPHPVADDANHRPAHPVFLLGEDAAMLRVQPNHFKEIGRDQAALDLLRRPPFEAAQVKRFPARDRKMLEDGIVAPVIKIVWIRNGDLRLVRVALGQDDQLVGFRIGERLEQDRVDDAKDGGVRANAERERENSDESEPRRLPELAQSVTEVVHVALRIIWPRLPPTKA
jgi:hypothetical protein